MATDPPTSPRLCSIEACGQPHFGRGYCRPHYRKNTPRTRSLKPIECIVCGAVTHKEPIKRKYGQVCSTECRYRLTWGWSEPLPEDHWARWYGTTCELPHDHPALGNPPKHLPFTSPATFISGYCAECGKPHTKANNGQWPDYCSRTCRTRVHRRTRRALEHNAPGSFRYVEVMRLYMANGKRCAYCNQTITGLPDPEHVLPLSRGGRNDITNLVAACRLSATPTRAT